MKLLVLLKSLRPEEHKDFEKFLQSPFFKAGPQYLKFFRYLCKRYPAFEIGKAEVQHAFLRCFGLASLPASKWYNLTSGLSKQIEQFMAVRIVVESCENKDQGVYDQLLVKSLDRRNMGAYFRAEAERVIAESELRRIKEPEDYFALQQLHQQIYFNHDTPKFNLYTENLEQAATCLDVYFCISKLRYIAEMKARERILDVRYEWPFLDAVMAYSEASARMDQHPLWAVYYQLVKLYLGGVDEPGFRQLMTIFVAQFPVLAGTDQTVLLQHLINCGISLIARDAAVEAELLSLYKLAIDAGILSDGNRITYLSFINIANLACLCKEFDWAEQFIARFSIYLEETKRQPATGLAKAGLFYNRGMLDEAQSCLTPEMFTIPSFDILTRALMSKIVFDRYLLYGKDYEFLMAHLKAFEKFVQLKSLTAEKKDSQLNSIKFIRKMAVLKFETVKVPESKKASLRKKLGQIQPVVSKKWLELKIDAL